MNILVVDDHPLIREALVGSLQRLGAGVAVRPAADCERALALAGAGPEPDLVLLDLNLPQLSGLAALKAWRSRFPAVPVVVLSADVERSMMLAALGAGAAGYVPKSTSSEVLLGAVRIVLDGGRYLPPELLSASASAAPRLRPTPASLDQLGLTARQLEVLKLLAGGAPNKVIGRELGLAERTVKAHVTALIRALKVSSRTQVALAAARLGLAAPSPGAAGRAPS